MSDSITIDTARLPLLLGELRLPTIGKLWQPLPRAPIARAGRPRAYWQRWPNSNSPSEPSDASSDTCWKPGCRRARRSATSTSPACPWSAMRMSPHLPAGTLG